MSRNSVHHGTLLTSNFLFTSQSTLGSLYGLQYHMFLSNGKFVKAIVLKDQWELGWLHNRGHLTLRHSVRFNHFKHSLESWILITTSSDNKHDSVTAISGTDQVHQRGLGELVGTHLVQEHQEFAVRDQAGDWVEQTLLSAKALGEVFDQKSLLRVVEHFWEQLELSLSIGMGLGEVDAGLLGVIRGRWPFLVWLLFLTVWWQILVFLEVVGESSCFLLNFDTVDWGHNVWSL